MHIFCIIFIATFRMEIFNVALLRFEKKVKSSKEALIQFLGTYF